MDIKEVGEVEIIQSRIEGVEIEIFNMNKITEAKEIGMLLDMNLEIKESIKKLKETIIKKESCILINCKIQMIQIILKIISQKKIVFMIRKKNRRIGLLIENNIKIKIIIQKGLDHIEEEGALEEEEVVDNKILMENKKMKKLLDHFHQKIFSLVIKKIREGGEIKIIIRILKIINNKRNITKMTIRLMKKDKVVKVRNNDFNIVTD